MHGGVDRAVALAGETVRLPVLLDGEVDALGAAVLEQVMLDVGKPRPVFEIGFREQGPDVVRVHLAAVCVGVALHFARKFHLQAARHGDAVFALQQVGNAALSGLAVDADYRFVAAPEVGRVDWQIGQIP